MALSPPRIQSAVTNGAQTIPVPLLNWSSGQLVAFTGSSAQSSAFSTTSDVIVEMSCNQDCYYTVGANPTASAAAGNQFMAAGSLRYVYVPVGQLVAAIQSTTGGNLTIVPNAFV